MLAVRKEYLDSLYAFRNSDAHKELDAAGFSESGWTSALAFEKRVGRRLFVLSSMFDGIGKSPDGHYNEFDYSLVYVTSYDAAEFDKGDGNYMGGMIEHGGHLSLSAAIAMVG